MADERPGQVAGILLLRDGGPLLQLGDAGGVAAVVREDPLHRVAAGAAEAEGGRGGGSVVAAHGDDVLGRGGVQPA